MRNINRPALPKLIVNSTKMDKKTISSSLKETLESAKEDQRLTCGIYESGQMLDMNPEGVMMVILPADAAGDITLNIHLMLIEAFCWENEIRVIKVDSAKKLAQIIADPKDDPLNDNEVARGQEVTMDDFNCILIEAPPGEEPEFSPAEEDIIEHYNKTCELVPQPIIDLDV